MKTVFILWLVTTNLGVDKDYLVTIYTTKKACEVSRDRALDRYPSSKYECRLENVFD